ncbi:ROK family protein [Streptomyces sp. NPDC048106]|uniref:ROK family protein n=1 Tax=Streptomyces sp. NPDC048106 TaxID=3155750 RepID=UPI00345454D3
MTGGLSTHLPSPAGRPGLLGIDIGGTKVALRVRDGAGDARETFRWPAAGDADGDLALLTERVRALARRRPAPPGAVGVAVPVACDPAGRVRTWPGRPGWEGLDLAAALRRMLPGTPLGWADDGDLAGLAEARAAGCRSMLYVGVGTGVGGGLVHDGRLWPGPGRGSFELGHLVVDAAGPRCDCGRTGCVQAAASGPATLRRATALRGRPVGFAELADGVRAAAPWATAAVDASAAALARAVVGVCELAHPERVVLGGGFGAGIPGFAATVAARVARLARPGADAVPVTPAALGALSSLDGALLLAADSLAPAAA